MSTFSGRLVADAERRRAPASARSSLTCRLSGSSPISSRKSVPPSAAWNLPGPARDRAGEGALHVPEELALDEVLGDGAAVDGDERAVHARAAAVELAGDELLAGARSRR